MFLEQSAVGCRPAPGTAAGEARHDLAQDRGVIFRFGIALGALDAEAGEILAQPRQRALVQEAGEIVGAVGHQFAAADADEQIEEFALDRVGVGAGGRFGEADMRDAERRRDRRAASASRSSRCRVRRARQQRREQRVFLRARRDRLRRRRRRLIASS